MEPMGCLAGSHHIDTVTFDKGQVLCRRDFVFDGRFSVCRLWNLYCGEHFGRWVCSNNFMEFLAQLFRHNSLQHQPLLRGTTYRTTSEINGCTERKFMIIIDDLVQQVGVIGTITKIVLGVKSRLRKSGHCACYQSVNCVSDSLHLTIAGAYCRTKGRQSGPVILWILWLRPTKGDR